MPHIIILGEWQDLLGQLHVYSDNIQNSINENAYHGAQLTEAQRLVDGTESLINSINANSRAEADDLVADMETFLGI